MPKYIHTDYNPLVTFDEEHGWFYEVKPGSPDEVLDFAPSCWFSLREFRCPCCQAVIVSSKLINKLTLLREELQFQVTISSGYRCEAKNTAVGGVPNSQHLKGTAVDIPKYTQDVVVVRTMRAALERRFAQGGMGEYSGHFHVDVRGFRARWRK